MRLSWATRCSCPILPPRCDFPDRSAEQLFASIQKILTLQDTTRIFVGHDYNLPGRDASAWETTVCDQKAHNVHIGGGNSQEAFAKMRETRDASLGMPEPDAASDVFLKLPINTL